MTAKEEGETILVRIPMKQRKRSGRKRIILPKGPETEQTLTDPPNSLVVALARAYKWQRMLDTGDVGSLDELAERLGIDRSYVGRMLKLTSLAPDVVETLLAVPSPATSLADLCSFSSSAWDGQRELMGFGGAGNDLSLH